MHWRGASRAANGRTGADRGRDIEVQMYFDAGLISTPKIVRLIVSRSILGFIAAFEKLLHIPML